MPDCIRNCRLLGQHQTSCNCTHECAEHDDHCKGCLPKQAITGQLCQRCVDRTVEALTAIPDLLAIVEASPDGRMDTPRVDTDTSRRSVSVHRTPSPAYDTAEEVAQWALKTAMYCADECQHRGPFTYRPDGVPALTTIRNLHYIRNNLPWFAAEYAQEIYDESVQFHRGLLYLTGTALLVHRIKEPCPSCGLKSLIREDGSNQVTCRNRNCGRIWREGEYDWLAHVATA